MYTLFSVILGTSCVVLENPDLVPITEYTSTNVLCIQNVIDDNQAQTLYAELEHDYHHFAYISPAEHGYPYNIRGTFVASRYPIQDVQPHSFSNASQEGFLQCTIQDTQNELHDIYLMNLSSNEDEIQQDQYTQVMDQIAHNTFRQKKSIHSTVCSNLPLSPRHITQHCTYLSEINQVINWILVKSSSNQGSSSHQEGGAQGTAGAKYEWGGNQGGSWSVYLEGEVHDGHGNYVQGKAEHNNKGEGSVSLEGGYKTEYDND